MYLYSYLIFFNELTFRNIDYLRHSIHPSNETNTNENLLPTETPITITTNPITTISPPEPPSNSSSIQSINTTDENNLVRRPTATSQLITNLVSTASLAPNRSSNSLFAKLTDAKKSLFGRPTTPDPFFSSADENKSLLSYLLSEPNPQLDVIQEYERNGAQLNAITDEGNNSIHILARAAIHSVECINIVDYLIKKGCDPNRQNDYGWTAG
jgi:ankyrin repeat protein